MQRHETHILEEKLLDTPVPPEEDGTREGPQDKTGIRGHMTTDT